MSFSKRIKNFYTNIKKQIEGFIYPFRSIEKPPFDPNIFNEKDIDLMQRCEISPNIICGKSVKGDIVFFRFNNICRGNFWRKIGNKRRHVVAILFLIPMYWIFPLFLAILSFETDYPGTLYRIGQIVVLFLIIGLSLNIVYSFFNRRKQCWKTKVENSRTQKLRISYSKDEIFRRKN